MSRHKNCIQGNYVSPWAFPDIVERGEVLGLFLQKTLLGNLCLVLKLFGADLGKVVVL